MRHFSITALLAAALGLRGIVHKRRRAFVWNKCRIHVDEVDRVGSFLEFEVMSAGVGVDDRARMARLVDLFRVDPTRAITGSYLDLLLGEA